MTMPSLFPAKISTKTAAAKSHPPSESASYQQRPPTRTPRSCHGCAEPIKNASSRLAWGWDSRYDAVRQEWEPTKVRLCEHCLELHKRYGEK